MDLSALTRLGKDANKIRERVLFNEAQQLLLENRSVVIDGTRRYFCILELGLGVYEFGLADIHTKSTRLVKNYIPALKEDGTLVFDLPDFS